MAADSKIEWTDHTFNPWVGCTKLSPACDNCYAEGWAKRAGRSELWDGRGARDRTTAANWRGPVKWDADAAAAGVCAKVFCASLADVFDNHREIQPEWRTDLWALIRATPNLDWLLLTKRPQNIAKMLPLDWGAGWSNVWLGTTVENQTEADRRIPLLLATPAAKRFLSCEPLLGPVDIRWTEVTVPGLDWVIAGGESGPNARPMHPDWARSLRDQCAATDVAFFMKQMGGKRKPFADIPDDLLIREFPA